MNLNISQQKKEATCKHGLGFETALALAGRGARIIIADKNDATESIRKIQEETNNKNLTYKYVDLSSLTSIRKFAKEINEEESRLDILINNAGASGFRNKFTEDGLQLGIQVNHFGPFLLTHLLIDLLKKSAPSRIIFVSSICAFLNNLKIENLNSKSEMMFDACAEVCLYGNTKLMNVITANILGDKLREYGVTTYSVHPGLVNTPIYRNFKGENALHLWKFFMYRILLPLYGKTPCEGAQTQIECALSRELEKETGKYYIDCRPFFFPWKVANKEFCQELWKKSEELVHLQESEKIL
ncbi:phosphatidylinositol-glycan biosynthesis class f protein-related [Holotrichia oblita]|uniref:Phosphatidylinositol-glycan biosynthesis class f protein-related n=1 Tax=Holotrichia oblita TaxID=644536 RepID=A0ACB9T1J0_HOLOL|nr:phosphatidylinositol-glycan biosynthesis class f protein-related [Holotrichia oblita]